jgi:hypothetical protein
MIRILAIAGWTVVTFITTLFLGHLIMIIGVMSYNLFSSSESDGSLSKIFFVGLLLTSLISILSSCGAIYMGCRGKLPWTQLNIEQSG